MVHVRKLADLYSCYMFGDPNCIEMMNWAVEHLVENSDCDDLDIILLASSVDELEIIDLTKRILRSFGLLACLEISRTELEEKIYRIFPNEPLPASITSYVENDPEDYDGEGQSVTDAFKGKSWHEVELDGLCGYYLTYFTPHPYVYFLPSYLILSLEEDEKNYEAKQRFFSNFVCDSESWSNKMVSVMNLLNDEQKEILLYVMRFVRSHDKQFYEECLAARRLLSS